MKRPKLNDERLELWHNDDKQLSKLLENLDHKVFNINTWQFRLNDKYLSFEEFKRKLGGKYPDLNIAEALKDNFIYLPDKFKTIKTELFTVFKRFTLNLQERLGYIDQLEKYVDFLEDQINLMNQEIEQYKREEFLGSIKKEMQDLKNMISKGRILEEPKKKSETIHKENSEEKVETIKEKTHRNEGDDNIEQK